MKKLNLTVTRIDNGFILKGDRTLCAQTQDDATLMLAKALSPLFADMTLGTENQIEIDITSQEAKQ